MANQTDINKEQWIKGLIKSIHEEIVAHQLLLNKLQAQQYAIMDRDVLHLFEINGQTLDSQKQAKVASNNRINILKNGKSIRPSYEFDSIEKVIPIVKKEFAEKLISQRQTLLNVVKDIKKLNKVSKHLLDKSIEFVNQNLNLINAKADFGGSYGADGNVAQETKGSSLSQLR
jgi:flagellar biosynthesis/type III secretory pathway chaperone